MSAEPRSRHPHRARLRPGIGTVRTALPGLALAAAGVLVAMALSVLIPGASALLVAIVLGVLVRNLAPMPAAVEPGLAFASKRILRIGVVLLGLQLSVGQILGIGPGMIAVVVLVVGLGIGTGVWIGRLLGLSRPGRLLIACGFSICGAAAVAAVDSVLDDDDEEEVVTAVALVVLFGTLMIPLLPSLAGWFGLSQEQAGLWAGASIHEVAQVVAAGGVIGGAALNLAVVVKLARVLMLAPVMLGIGAIRRRDGGGVGRARPPIMPLFVFGFLCLVAVRSLCTLPAVLLDTAKTAEVVCLAAAMFALGTGVRIQMFRRVGVRPFILAASVTLVVGCVGLVGVLLVG